jgi:hypothetical protein
MTVLPHVIAGLALLVALAVPRTAHAGIGDFIWEMSGPELFGLGVQCDIWFAKAVPHCKTPLDLARLSGRNEAEKRIWIRVEGTGYFSTTKDQGPLEFSWFRTWMVGADPVLHFGGWPFLGGRAYHGIGGSFNWLMGEFSSFGNLAWKAEPIAVRYGTVEYAMTLRRYGNGFDGDPSQADHLSKGTASELVVGGVVRLVVPPLRKPPTQ